MSEKDTKQTFISPLSGRYGGPDMSPSSKIRAGKGAWKMWLIFCGIAMLFIIMIALLG